MKKDLERLSCYVKQVQSLDQTRLKLVVTILNAKFSYPIRNIDVS